MTSAKAASTASWLWLGRAFRSTRNHSGPNQSTPALQHMSLRTMIRLSWSPRQSMSVSTKRKTLMSVVVKYPAAFGFVQPALQHVSLRTRIRLSWSDVPAETVDEPCQRQPPLSPAPLRRPKSQQDIASPRQERTRTASRGPPGFPLACRRRMSHVTHGDVAVCSCRKQGSASQSSNHAAPERKFGPPWGLMSMKS